MSLHFVNIVVAYTFLLQYFQIPVMPFDNDFAAEQMEAGYSTLLNRPVANACGSGPNASCISRSLALDEKDHPRVRNILMNPNRKSPY
jgi:hypothetical protein